MKQSAATGSSAGTTITAAHHRLCMLRGTKIDTGHATSRYYYKGLCVVARRLSPSASERVLTAFWTPRDLKAQQTFQAMLNSGTPRKNLPKKATVTLLMLRKEY
jgi:hypothetical protein